MIYYLIGLIYFAVDFLFFIIFTCSKHWYYKQTFVHFQKSRKKFEEIILYDDDSFVFFNNCFFLLLFFLFFWQFVSWHHYWFYRIFFWQWVMLLFINIYIVLYELSLRWSCVWMEKEWTTYAFFHFLPYLTWISGKTFCKPLLFFVSMPSLAFADEWFAILSE